MLTWDFIVMNIEDNNIAYAPKVHNFFIIIFFMFVA